MFKKGILFGILGLLTLTLGHAQVPDAFSYQAVVRSNNKELLKNQTVTVKATILIHDEVIFTQTQTATTNENGLLTLTLGNEEFQEINWLDGPLFIKTEIDPTGGNNFTIETETQLLTVPYAMAAKTAETAQNVPDLYLLIERIENLETQVEELKEFLYGNPIPFEEFLLDGNCNWINLSYDEMIIIIKDHQELENYIDCADGNYPEIDFSQQSLLLVSGKKHFGISSIEPIKFQKVTINNYEFEIEITIDDGRPVAAELWHLAVIIPSDIPENYSYCLKITIPDEAISEWRCIIEGEILGFEGDYIIDLTFYPLENKLHIYPTYPDKNTRLLNLLYLFSYESTVHYFMTKEYYSEDEGYLDKMFHEWDENGNPIFDNQSSWFILYDFLPYLVMDYGGFAPGNVISAYGFIRQTK